MSRNISALSLSNKKILISFISLHEKAETFKKMVHHKRKQKRDENMRKREEKMKELEDIEREIARLEV